MILQDGAGLVRQKKKIHITKNGIIKRFFYNSSSCEIIA